MTFGNNLCQNDKTKYEPQPNNYCGGFAMCAILTDSMGTAFDPIEVYNSIQKFQQDVCSPSLYRIIEAMKPAGNQTCICLPSSLVNIAVQEDFEVHLKYSDLLKPHFNTDAIIAETQQCEKCKNVTVAVIAPTEILSTCFCDKEVRYYLVLVNGCHWIAVKREKNGDSFSVYDPGTGENMKFTDSDDMILCLEEKYMAVGALIITIKYHVR